MAAVETMVVVKNTQDCYIYPRIGAGPADGRGWMLRAVIDAPGVITGIGVDKNSAYVHDCPNGGYCPAPYTAEFVAAHPNQWEWYGWTNSADPSTLTFTVSFVRHEFQQNKLA